MQITFLNDKFALLYFNYATCKQTVTQ